MPKMKPSEKKRLTINIISILSIIFFLGLAFYSYGKTKWIIDNSISAIVVMILWLNYRKLHLNVALYSMTMIMLILHNLGTFGFYSNWYFGIEWDFYVHFYFGLFFSMALFNLLIKELHPKISPKLILLLTILITCGVGSMNELLEFTGASVLGEGEGVLFFGTGDTGLADTEWDLINNFLGSLLGSFFLFLTHRKVYINT